MHNWAFRNLIINWPRTKNLLEMALQPIFSISWDKINSTTVSGFWSQLSCSYDCLFCTAMIAESFSIFFSISNLILSISLTHSSHKIVCMLSRQNFEQYKKHNYQRYTYLLSLQISFLPAYFVGSLLFSVDYFFCSWHFSIAQWFTLRCGRWFGAKYSIYFSEPNFIAIT